VPKLRFISRAPFLGLVFTGFLAARADLASASLIVSEWRLASGVQDLSNDITVNDFSNFAIVQNPFSALAENAIGPNTATTSYDFSWSGDTGSFDVTVAENVETRRVRSISSGIIFISPTADLRMTVDASLDFSSVPGDLAFIGFSMRVWDPITLDVFFNENLIGGNLTLEPAVGTLAFSGDVVLPAGATYRIDFRAQSDTLDEDNPSGPVTSSGFFHFAFQPVPEPATAWLITLGAIAVRRRRRRCRQEIAQE
jgi:hypothetical protein